ncbi:NAD(P)-dependent oxidoreductase [Sphingomonas sp. AX6]|uniref:NAD(P)-dependent oxidoreductase n=1 Tax=Sphingomonas sp. AX6 TaxID=2653171 RepID=UPI0012F459C2|nr:NAD(P)-dependent oxidoreductase [Sphingomonas sp. AX6]VXC72648.1 NAD(P)-dependent oxidoreductase [Sphingomonas sp. AX6]
MRLVVFGMGYSARNIVQRLGARAVLAGATTRDGRDGTLRFDDREGVARALAAASHVLSSVPPEGDRDSVRATYGDLLGGLNLAYLSSTGVYGDTGGAWVDESAATGGGRRVARVEADAAWLALGARVFRLPGIYGPGRSPLDRVATGQAHRVDVSGQIFSRIHVDDLADGVIAGWDGPPGAYNLSDDEPAPQSDVIAYAARLLGLDPPPLIPLDHPSVSPAARAFYAENRRVANGKAKRVLGWRPAYPDYRLGLRALSAITSPIIASTPPPSASGDQR